MSFPDRLALASRNPGKTREILSICADWPVEWITADSHPGPWPEVDEPHDSYLDNALAKAHAVAVATGVPALADDSGIEVDALGGGPGPRSARYAGESVADGQNIAMMLRALAEVPEGGRSARYRCVAVIAWPDGRKLFAEGGCEGTIAGSPRGSSGFGYDPIFVPAGWDRTMAELPREEKDRISHRGRALRTLRERLVGGPEESPFRVPEEG
ncbi:MAG: non-canonical purine NTP pyrophosphatase [Actinomycetota bacterium]